SRPTSPCSPLRARKTWAGGGRPPIPSAASTGATTTPAARGSSQLPDLLPSDGAPHVRSLEPAPRVHDRRDRNLDDRQLARRHGLGLPGLETLRNRGTQ